MSRKVFSWCLYDWANSAFSTVVQTFVFSTFFTSAVMKEGGDSAWATMTALSGLAVALASPVFGAIADHGGRRKRWLALFSGLCLIPAAGLWFVEPAESHALLALLLVGLASFGFELGIAFYNALLPSVAPAGRMGRVSGWGFAMGYAGGLMALALTLFGLIGLGDIPPWLPLPDDAGQPARAAGPLVAVWFALFALPLFLFVPEPPGRTLPLGAAVKAGLRQLSHTLATLKRLPETTKFLVASAFYRDGLNTLFAMGGVYAHAVYGMALQEVLVFAIGLNVTAGLGAFAFGFLDDRLGSKPTILISLAGLLVSGLALLVAPDKSWFIALGLALGAFVGPAQAASRTLMAKLAPAEMQSEFFGLFNLTGKSVSFIGPALYAWAVSAFQPQAGLATIILMWILGGALLLAVRPSETA